ncbi:hypothetical protein LT336_00051 [Spiroplasma sp. JKS002671]|uniref:hypothetical protein n=1 Tax=Spiroplasma attinicola TaxID=2904537 RepID=UPI002022B236|nr:hypothetical protein [Spiroplasma sp. JKS002671]MCL8210321.1 hypothetical protein [Spiroplasma sp. JKS002671]
MANVKNELLSKEKNKERKKYLKSETFMLMLAIILIGIGAGLGIYYGINANHSEINKTNLSDFNKAAIIGSENMSVDDAFNAFLDNNKNKNLTNLRDNVDLTFIKPSYITTGSLTIIAKADTKYTGSITISINAITQKNLSELNLKQTLTQPYTEQTEAFQAFIKLNSQVSDLETNVKIDSFNRPNYGQDGSLVINGINKYTGILTISINAITQTNIATLGLVTNINGTIAIINDNSGSIALETFLNANNEKHPELKANVKIDSFNRPNYGRDGSLIINGINKYTGVLTITINGIIPTDQDIVDAVINSSIVFDAVKSVNETLQHFINSVLRGQGNPYNPDNDPLWYIKGQLKNHINSYPILRFADVNKYQFIKFCLKDSNHTPLTDDYLDNHSIIGETITFQINFNYGTVKNQYINFNLSFKQ